MESCAASWAKRLTILSAKMANGQCLAVLVAVAVGPLPLQLLLQINIRSMLALEIKNRHKIDCTTIVIIFPVTSFKKRFVHFAQ